MERNSDTLLLMTSDIWEKYFKMLKETNYTSPHKGVAQEMQVTHDV